MNVYTRNIHLNNLHHVFEFVAVCVAVHVAVRVAVHVAVHDAVRVAVCCRVCRRVYCSVLHRDNELQDVAECCKLYQSE
jgi:hypothetical protein